MGTTQNIYSLVALIKKGTVKGLKYYFSILLSLFLVTSCQDSFIPEDIGHVTREDGLPLDIIVSYPSDATRGIEEAKTKFESGDLIHIIATFNCQNETEGEYTVKTYGIMQCTGNGNWQPFNSGTKYRELSWPGECKTASFYAVHIPGSNGALSSNTGAPRLLSSYSYTEDPLEASTDEIPYGHSIYFDFKHIFSHLSVVDFEPGFADEFWFTRSTSDAMTDFNNAFNIEFNDDENNPEIQKVFSAIPDEHSNLVYISGKCDVREGEDVDPKYAGVVNFFLEPGWTLDKFKLVYPSYGSTTSTFFTYQSTSQDNEGNDVIKLESNHAYTFSVLKSQGVLTEVRPGEEWDESDPVDIDVEKFIKAVVNGDEYRTDDGTLVLQKIDGGTQLIRNIDFKYHYYDVLRNQGNLLPNLDRVFNGAFHYIYHTSCPIFNKINAAGEVKNVGIIDIDTDNSDDPTYKYWISTVNPEVNEFPDISEKADFSFNGALARRNLGKVNNIRISKVNIKAYVLTSNQSEQDKEAHNIGIVLGSNSDAGIVNGVSLADHIQLSVENYGDETIVPNIFIGTVAGQNASYLSNINPIEEEKKDWPLPEITITNKCVGETGIYMIGGITGNNVGSITDVFLPKIKIDSRNSEGLHSLIGGGVGQQAYDQNFKIYLGDINIIGEVIAGNMSDTREDNYSYTGGIAGQAYLNSTIEDCKTIISVAGAPAELNNGGITGTGCAFGRLILMPGVELGKISRITSYGDNLTGQGSIGRFAGVSITGFDENYFSNPDLEINVKNFSGIEEYIGKILE